MPRKNEVQLLTEARALLARRGGWIKGAYSRGDGTSYCSIGAMLGALQGKLPNGTYRNARGFLGQAVVERAGLDIVIFNDAKKTRKRDILAVFDRAIELASQ